MSFYKINGKLFNTQYIHSICCESFHSNDIICVLMTKRNVGYLCVNCDSTTPCQCIESLYELTIHPSDPDYDAWKALIDAY
jgi:hypothetical protein